MAAEEERPTLRFHRAGRDRLLVDPRRLPRPEARVFEPEHWRAAGRLEGTAAGRGPVSFVRGENGETWVLRHYRRGGAAARLSEDAYFRLGLFRSRPFRELHLLAELRGRGLPVPDPVGARVRVRGWRYRGDLLTVRVPGRPLNDQIRAGRPDPAAWKAAGACVRRFHDAGLDHADLHGDNVLVEGKRVHLIDLDRAHLGRPGPAIRRRNLSRFRRSLRKLLGADWESDPAWSACWMAFEAGYEEAAGRSPEPG